MPGGPAYPGGLPGRDRRRPAALLRPRPRLHPPLVGDRRQRARPCSPAPAGSSPGSRSPAAPPSSRWPRPTSYGEIVALDLATGAETVLTDHGAPCRRRALRPREERTFTISDGTEVQGWLVRDPERDGPAPLLLDVHGGPHNAWNAAADEMHLYHQELAARGLGGAAGQPARQRRLRRGVLRRRAAAPGASRTHPTSSSRSTRSSPRASPTRTGSRSPATATAGS